MEFDDFFLIRWFSIMTVRRFWLKLHGFCPEVALGSKQGKVGEYTHTYKMGSIFLVCKKYFCYFET